VRFDIAYDGTIFSGWATHPGELNLPDMVEEAISRIVRYDVDSIVAGRTDAGVHATGQVIHVDIPDAPLAAESASEIASIFPQAAGSLEHIETLFVPNAVPAQPPGFTAKAKWSGRFSWGFGASSSSRAATILFGPC
jgi:tRNA U38,U39,U40 pseudouridine synthase TruA